MTIVRKVLSDRLHTKRTGCLVGFRRKTTKELALPFFFHWFKNLGRCFTPEKLRYFVQDTENNSQASTVDCCEIFGDFQIFRNTEWFLLEYEQLVCNSCIEFETSNIRPHVVYFAHGISISWNSSLAKFPQGSELKRKFQCMRLFASTFFELIFNEWLVQ